MKGRYVGLDALRGVGAFIVLLHHLGQWQGTHGLARQGYVTVDMFFALSGFVIARTYGARLGRDMSVAEFGRRRVIRLWPVVIIAGLVAAASAALQNLHPEARHVAPLVHAAVLGFVLLIPISHPSGDGQIGGYYWGTFPLNAPLWSLQFEVYSNALYPFAAPRLRTWHLATTFGVCAVIMALTTHGGTLAFDGSKPPTWWLGFPRTGLAFSAGVLLSRLPAPRLQTPLVVLCLGMATAFSLPHTTAAGDLALVILGVPLLVWLGQNVRAGPRGAWLSDMTGRLSYPVYALHYLCQPAVVWFVGQHHPGLAGLAGLDAAFMVVAWAAGAVVLLWVDEPLRAWLERAWRARAKLPVRAAAAR